MQDAEMRVETARIVDCLLVACSLIFQKLGSTSRYPYIIDLPSATAWPFI
jgi:hypothetical protein